MRVATISACLCSFVATIVVACSTFGTGARDGGEAIQGDGSTDGSGSTSGSTSGDANTGDTCSPGSTEVVVDASVISDGADAGKCSRVNGGVVFNDNCFWVPAREPLTFEFANTRCQQPDPKDHIITIGSAAENEFATGAFPTCEDRWIGLSATAMASPVGDPAAADFKWKNTAPDSFRRWADGFPRGPGRCVVLRPDGFWENRSCIEVHTVLCERE